MIVELLAVITIMVATMFSVIGVVGFRRLPDVYTRLHATGKVGVLGVVMLLIAAVLVTPLVWSKALVLILLLLVVGPVTAHVLALAAYELGIEMKEGQQDDLQGVFTGITAEKIRLQDTSEGVKRGLFE
ncbi:MAG TPA: monovalent cation/H(+) antiporter subunit G [Anaerolineae bacterium]|nr:monovalent cation/H(+) antiporter subunit G [Anaerolineae bacterium]